MKKIRMLLSIMILASLMGMYLPSASAQTMLRCYVKADAIGANTGDSWENAYTDLQSALGTSPCTEIWVAAGTYYPGTARADTFTLKSGVAIYGGFNGTEEQLSERDPATNISMLSGEIGLIDDTHDNSYHVITSSSTDSTATLDGFTISFGRADGGTSNNFGGGMDNSSGSPNLTNLNFINNSAAISGGGIYIIDGNPTLTNVTFSSNKAGVYGAGLYIKNSDSTLSNVTFFENFASSKGGGMAVFDDCTVLLTNTTFANNYAREEGKAIWVYWEAGDSKIEIHNSIFWNSEEVYPIFEGLVREIWIYDSILQFGCLGKFSACQNVISTDPLLGEFANNGGFTQTMALEPASPAIDAGNNDICALTDQRGVTRPKDGDNNGTTICDMGSYEFTFVITSILRADPNPTSGNTVRFHVTFSEPVQNVDASDFILTTTGNMGASSITNVSGSDADYTVSVETASGNGTIRLDVKEATDIQDLTGNNLVGGFASGDIYTVKKRLTLRSQPAYDGYIWESTETSGIGLRGDSTGTTFSIGDDNIDRQYRAILSFNTESLPDDAVITRIALRIKQSTTVGVDPFTTHGGLKVDIRKPYFGTTAILAPSDFQVTASRPAVGAFGIAPVNGWYTAVLTSASYPYLNLAGTTQFRLRFQLDDNDDMSADYTKFFSGNYTVASYRPTIIIDYFVP
ncbi:MAG: choice-of-anchor Q domain-containing protein [Chloroflexota bacterium]